jgi:hypothetical protein
MSVPAPGLIDADRRLIRVYSGQNLRFDMDHVIGSRCRPKSTRSTKSSARPGQYSRAAYSSHLIMFEVVWLRNVFRSGRHAISTWLLVVFCLAASPSAGEAATVRHAFRIETWSGGDRSEPICFSPYLYRARNLVERFFNKIKHCRRVATRYDKIAANYLAFIQLAAIRLWLRVNESTS